MKPIDRDLAIRLIDERIRREQEKHHEALPAYMMEFYCMGLRRAKEILLCRAVEVKDERFNRQTGSD